MTLLDILALLLTLSAVFGTINHHVLKLPQSIGLLAIALIASIGILAIDQIWPHLNIAEAARAPLEGIDFHEALLNGFLSALLFAGAIHLDLSALREQRWPILAMATIGVLISTAVVGGAFYAVTLAVGASIPFIWCLVFGALISPTDPVAVLGLFKTVKVPQSIKTKIAGESLFNDGVAVVVFLAVVAVATGGGGGHGEGEVTALDIARLFLVEAVGGALLGIVVGYVCYLMMKSLEEPILEVMMTLALVTAVYAIALRLHVSGPIAVVIAGLLIGNRGARLAMGPETRRHVFDFWEIVDEILNAVLFLLIGLEVLVLGAEFQNWGLALAAIPIVLAARWISVAVPITVLRLRTQFSAGAIRILTWGGLRGGISVALALSLANGPYKPAILTATYLVTVFSIIVQGLTMSRLVRHVLEPGAVPAKAGPARPEAARDAGTSPVAPRQRQKGAAGGRKKKRGRRRR
ncbi:MAG: sodium:proton antiporter [Hyphomicrobiaceae bacterium]